MFENNNNYSLKRGQAKKQQTLKLENKFGVRDEIDNIKV